MFSWTWQRREQSPDRSDWTPDAGHQDLLLRIGGKAATFPRPSRAQDFADEQKEKADAAFKEGIYRHLLRS